MKDSREYVNIDWLGAQTLIFFWSVPMAIVGALVGIIFDQPGNGAVIGIFVGLILSLIHYTIGYRRQRRDRSP